MDAGTALSQMQPILDSLRQCCAPLLESSDFKVVRSESGRSGFEGASILMESNDVEIFVASEREQIAGWIRSKYDPNPQNWFSIDLISNLFARPAETGVMDEGNLQFLRSHMGQVIDRFRQTSVRQTLEQLNALKRARAKRLRRQ